MFNDVSGICAAILAILCMSTMTIPGCAEDKVVTEYVMTDFQSNSGWRITTLHSSPSSSGFKDGILTCDFTSEPGYVGLGTDLTIPGKPQEVSLTYESNKSGHPIVLRFADSQHQCFQKEIARLDSDGLKTVKVDIRDMSQWFHFQGTDDGVVRPPLRLIEIIVDHNGLNASLRLVELKAKTEISLDEGVSFGLTSRDQASSADTLTMTCSSILPWDVKARYSWRVTDFFGKELDSGQERISIPPGKKIERKLKVSRKGIKLCDFRLDADIPVDTLSGEPSKPLKTRPGAQMVSGPTTIQVTKTIPTSVVELKPGGTPELLPDSPFGMGIYLGQRWAVSDMEKPAEIARSIGIKWMRDEFNWGHVEPRKGEWNFQRFDASVDMATRHGISIFGLLCYWSPWAKPHTPEGIQDYCNYVKTVVNRYKDRVHYWEIWNEPNIFFWTGTIEQYTELMKAGYDAIKEADPNAKAIGCCTAGTDLNFIEQVFKFGGFDKMDILSIHPYRYPPTPEETDLVAELRRADALVRKYGKPKEIWVTEIGWPTNIGGNGSSEAKQAAMIVRTYILGIASGVVQKTFWYNFRNDGHDVNYNEHNFGIIRQDHSQKPACVAFRTMTQALEGKELIRPLSEGKGVYAYLFEGKGGRVIAAWASSGTAKLVLSGAGESVTNLIGERKALRQAAIEVSGNPVFIEGVPADVNVDVMDVNSVMPGKEEQPVRITVSPTNESGFAVELTPRRSLDEAKVTVRIPGYADEFMLPKGKKVHREDYSLPAGSTLGTEKGLPVSVVVDTGTGIVSKRPKVYYAPCRRASGITVDGSLGDWNLDSPIRLGKPGHVQQLDKGKWSGPEDLSAEIWTAWDDSNFYMAARVKDDVFSQKESGADVWKGDNVQFALDPLHIEAPGTTYEIGLALTPSGPEVYCWYSPEGKRTGLIREATLAVIRSGDLTTYEVSIPLSVLDPLKSQTGKTVGFSIILNDDDGEGRKGWLEWTSGIGRQKSPSQYGDLTFTQ